MECLCGVLKVVCSIILGSIRLILFALSFLLVLIQLVWLRLVISSKNAGLPLPASDLDNTVFLHSTLLICTGLLGCWATFFRSDRKLKYFSVMAAMCTIFLILAVATMHNLQNKERIDYLKMLEDKAKYYDWKGNGRVDDGSAEATRIWDSLQSIGCCGIVNATDWDQFRPSNIDKRYLPTTCCSLESVDKVSGLCSKDNIYSSTGCDERVRYLEDIKSVLYFVSSLSMIISTILSCLYILVKCVLGMVCTRTRQCQTQLQK